MPVPKFSSVAAAGYLALYGYLTWPLMLAPQRTVLLTNGDGFFDMLLFRYARDGGLFKGHVASLFYPWGTDVGADHGIASVPLLSVPLQVVMPLPLVFNVLAAFFFVATGLATYLLSREIGAPRWGAFLAGLLLITSPNYLSELSQGILENASLQWLILFVWSGLRMRAQGTPRLAVWTGVFFALTVLTSMYQIAFALVFLPLLPLRRVLPVAAAALLLVSPLLLPALRAHGGSGLLYDPQVASALVEGRIAATEAPRLDVALRYESTRQALTESADWYGLFVRHRVSKFRHVLPGVLLLGLAALGAWRRGRASLPWVALAAFFLLAALGPYLQWDGRAVARLPMATLYDLQPLLLLPRPARMLLAATIPLAVLASFALPAFRSRTAQAGAALVLCALQLCEALAIYRGPYHATLHSAAPPAYYQRLAASAAGAVIELPLMPQSVTVGRNLFFQTVHGHDMLNYDFVRPGTLRQLSERAADNPLLAFLLKGEGTVTRRDAAWPAAQGFIAIIVHSRVPVGEGGAPPTPQDFNEPLFDGLRQLYGEPRDEGDGLLVFDPRKLASDAPRALRWHPLLNRAEGSRSLAALLGPRKNAELRAWVRGGPGRLSVRRGDVDIAAEPINGDRAHFRLVRLPLPDGSDALSADLSGDVELFDLRQGEERR